VFAVVYSLVFVVKEAGLLEGESISSAIKGWKKRREI
jgi:hypothetical protein